MDEFGQPVTLDDALIVLEPYLNWVYAFTCSGLQVNSTREQAKIINGACDIVYHHVDEIKNKDYYDRLRGKK